MGTLHPGRLHGGSILTGLWRMGIVSFRERPQKLKRKYDYRVRKGRGGIGQDPMGKGMLDRPQGGHRT